MKKEGQKDRRKEGRDEVKNEGRKEGIWHEELLPEGANSDEEEGTQRRKDKHQGRDGKARKEGTA